MKIRVSIATFLLLGPSFAMADWILDNDQSSISFTSIKANSAAEVHGFRQLTGSISKAGAAKISIDLRSVDTNIEIRDERMRELLFETEQYPTAIIGASINAEHLAALKPGKSDSMNLDIDLAIHGTSSKIAVPVTVVRLTKKRLLVSSEKPVIVNADQLGLADGVEKLREIAGLPSISPAVPVTFVLWFDAEK